MLEVYAVAPGLNSVIVSVDEFGVECFRRMIPNEIISDSMRIIKVLKK